MYDGCNDDCRQPALVLMPLFADSLFHRGSEGLGFLKAAMGIGVVIGTLVLAGRSDVADLSRVILYSSATLGAGFFLFSVSRSFNLSLLLMPVIGFSVMRQIAATNTSMQAIIPHDYRGRIMTLYSMAVVGNGPFGAIASGALARSISAPATVRIGGALCLAASPIFAWHIRKQYQATDK